MFKNALQFVKRLTKFKRFYTAVRTGSSNTHFFSVVFFCFFGGHLPQTSGFRSAKQILVVSFATQARAFILSDRNIFYTPGGGENNGGV